MASHSQKLHDDKSNDYHIPSFNGSTSATIFDAIR